MVKVETSRVPSRDDERPLVTPTFLRGGARGSDPRFITGHFDLICFSQ